MWTNTTEMLKHHVDSRKHMTEGTESTIKSVDVMSKYCSESQCSSKEGLSSSCPAIESDVTSTDEDAIGEPSTTDSPAEISIMKNKKKESILVTEGKTNDLKENSLYIKKNVIKYGKDGYETTKHHQTGKITSLKAGSIVKRSDYFSTEKRQEIKQRVLEIIKMKHSEDLKAIKKEGTHGLASTNLKKELAQYIKKIVKQDMIVSVDEQQKLEIKNGKNSKSQGQNIAVVKSESCSEITNDDVEKDTMKTQQKYSVISYSQFEKASDNKKAGVSGITVKNETSSTTNQGNRISASILDDWVESDESDSKDNSLQAEVISIKKETYNDVENVKELKNVRKEKLCKSQTKQPRLFEDVLLSDDENSQFSGEENVEIEFKSDLSFDNKKKTEYFKVSPKNYLKRRRSSDSFRYVQVKCYFIHGKYVNNLIHFLNVIMHAI